MGKIQFGEAEVNFGEIFEKKGIERVEKEVKGIKGQIEYVVKS